MDVRDAIASRYSCRAFLPTPVPERTVREIVERAARAPSAGNIQPWRVDALAGERLEALTRADAAAHERAAERRGHRISDLSARSAAALSRAPLRRRRDALSLDRRRARGQAGALPAICAQFRVLRRAGRPVRLASNDPSCSGNGSTSAATSRPSCCSRAPSGCTPARRRPGRRFPGRCRRSSNCLPNMMLFCGMALGHADEDGARSIHGARPGRALADFATLFRLCGLIAADSLLLTGDTRIESGMSEPLHVRDFVSLVLHRRDVGLHAGGRRVGRGGLRLPDQGAAPDARSEAARSCRWPGPSGRCRPTKARWSAPSSASGRMASSTC